jgi:two-component system sensor histidine kinase RegB
MSLSLIAFRGGERPSAIQRLVALRWGLLAGEVLTILGVPWLLGISLPVAPMLMVVALQAVANTLAAWRNAHSSGVGDNEFAMQLVTDIAALTVLMFFSGGAANPLISLLLPPVAIAALVLPPRLVGMVAALAVGAYSMLNVTYLPLPVSNAERAARLHLTGMWLTFVLSAVLLAWLMVRMRASLAVRDLELAAVREQVLRDERVMALGALAAGAAHELSTPLATMAIITGELIEDAAIPKTVRADIALLHREVNVCKEIISGLAERAGAGRLDSAAAVDAGRWLTTVFSRWREMRPHADAELDLSGVSPRLTLTVDATLEQGLLNLFNNAADAGSQVRVSAVSVADGLRIEVRDNGAGFPPHVIAHAGRMPFPPHAGGSGIGLLLAHAAITRLGGSLMLQSDHGGVACVCLPVTAAD